MLQIFYGDDRLRAQKDIKSILGTDYELVKGEELDKAQLDSLFLGETLFAKQREILIKDMGANTDCLARLINYVDTEHDVIVWEMKFPATLSVVKELKKKVRCIEYKKAEERPRGFVFGIMDKALAGQGKVAVEMCEEIRYSDNAVMVIGALAWKAIDNYKKRPCPKNKQIIKMLAQTDLEMKSRDVEAWLQIEALLLRIASLN